MHDLARTLFREMVSEIDPQMNASTDIHSSGGPTDLRHDGESAGQWHVDADYKRFEKRVLFRVQFGKSLRTGLALAISDLTGPPTVKTVAPGVTVTEYAGVPEEVLTILGSFGRRME